jgi:hypothetical protein
MEGQSAGNSRQHRTPPGREIPTPLFAESPKHLFCLQALNQWQIAEGITPLGLTRPASLEHAGIGVLGLNLGDQKRDEVALCGAVLLEGLPQPVMEQWRSGVGQIAEHLLLDWCASVSHALPKLVIDCGGFSAHEVIVTPPAQDAEAPTKDTQKLLSPSTIDS